MRKSEPPLALGSARKCGLISASGLREGLGEVQHGVAHLGPVARLVRLEPGPFVVVLELAQEVEEGGMDGLRGHGLLSGQGRIMLPQSHSGGGVQREVLDSNRLISTTTETPDGPRRSDRPAARTRTQRADRAHACPLFTRELALEDVPEAVIERAKLHILDALGIGLAASRYDFSHKTLTAIHGLAGDGPYPVIGMPAGLPLRDAAQMNGFLIHGLDYDDTHVGGVIHATASAVPTVLAAGQRHGASGTRDARGLSRGH